MEAHAALAHGSNTLALAEHQFARSPLGDWETPEKTRGDVSIDPVRTEFVLEACEGRGSRDGNRREKETEAQTTYPGMGSRMIVFLPSGRIEANSQERDA